MVEIKYKISDLRNFMELKVYMSEKTISEFIKENPKEEYIFLKRKIIKIIDEHLIFFNVPFPLPKFEYDFQYTILRQKKLSSKYTTSDLLVYGDMLYCDNCLFTLFYNIGDSILIVRNLLNN